MIEVRDAKKHAKISLIECGGDIYDDQFLYLHFFSFSILVNHNFNVIS